MKTSSAATLDFFFMVWTLFILFLGLKLADMIDWSWLWVFAPLWTPIAFIGALFVVLLPFAIIGSKK